MKYKLFGNSGLRVSEVCLGTMTFGTESAIGADYETSKEVFDVFADAGGTFIDTANAYTFGTSEKWVGEFIHQDRDHFVLATKYSISDRKGDLNFSGNHRKNMIRSVEGSLKRLNTDYIDLFWLHYWDYTTPVEEIMRAFDDLVTSRKVNYIGMSDTPAWIVSRAQTMAELRGWHTFAGLQIEFSLITPDGLRDLLPMAKELGLAVTPWGAMGGGALSGKYLKDANAKGRVPENSKRRNERAQKITKVVMEIAEETLHTPAQIALNWTRQRDQVVIPIIGARTSEQLKDSLGCIEFEIPLDAMERLNEVSKIELGFPHDFLSPELLKNVFFGGEVKDFVNHKR